MRALSVGFVVPYGEPSEGFFPDTLLAELCAEARALGHRAEVVRVYYDGRDAGRDREVAERLERWLEARDVDLVVLERLFDPAPVEAHVAKKQGRRAMLIVRGDSFDPSASVSLVIGTLPGLTKSGGTRRTPRVAEVSRAFVKTLDALASGGDPTQVAGVAWLNERGQVAGSPLEPAEPTAAYRAVAEHDVIALGEPPRVIRKTLFGNAGCPYADDPLKTTHFKGLTLPDGPLARLGCAFCSMGGDYEKRPDDEVTERLVEQALFWTTACPDIEELVLDDQFALRYLPALLRQASAAGVRPIRFLFAARPDAFVRERARLDRSLEAAEETGHRIEVYLSGFEAFCDAELSRYNKGATVADQGAAIAAMREIRKKHPRSFSYAEAKGHSLILWSPWTTPEDLRESLSNIRANGARELFHEIGRNRLRLYGDLPITYAAERDGATTEAWQDGDEGAGRRKGYNVERPWRFLDPRTSLAFELSRRLRDKLGAESEMASLRAIVDFVTPLDKAQVTVPQTCDRVMSDLEALLLEVGRWMAGRGEGDPERGATKKASVVRFAGSCNNHCDACPNSDRYLDDDPISLEERVDAARARSLPLVLAGREPTVHSAFLALVARARGRDATPVCVVSNGRRFAYPAFTRAATAAGLSGASIKLFAPRAEIADRISRDEGGFAQALRGLVELSRAGLRDLEIRAPLHRDNLADLSLYAPLAARANVRQIRVELALDAIGLLGLSEAVGALRRLAERCVRDGIALEVSPLEASTTLFDRAPG